MKTLNEAKEAYIKDHLSKPLKSPNIRLNALKTIESAIKENNCDLLKESNLFQKFNESALIDYYQKLKGSHLNSAEKSVIHGLYKFSV